MLQAKLCVGRLNRNLINSKSRQKQVENQIHCDQQYLGYWPVLLCSN